MTRDFENFEFNTIISSLMELMNEMYKAREAGAAGSDEWNEALEIYLKMMAPVTPHIAEELWTAGASRTPSTPSNGRLWTRLQPARTRLPWWYRSTANCATASPCRRMFLMKLPRRQHWRARLKKYLEGKTPKQVVYVKGRLVNIVV